METHGADHMERSVSVFLLIELDGVEVHVPQLTKGRKII